jgi:hypothetical protein
MVSKRRSDSDRWSRFYTILYVFDSSDMLERLEGCHLKTSGVWGVHWGHLSQHDQSCLYDGVVRVGGNATNVNNRATFAWSIRFVFCIQIFASMVEIG